MLPNIQEQNLHTSTLVMPIQQNQAVVKAYINRRLHYNQQKEHSNTVKFKIIKLQL